MVRKYVGYDEFRHQTAWFSAARAAYEFCVPSSLEFVDPGDAPGFMEYEYIPGVQPSLAQLHHAASQYLWPGVPGALYPEHYVNYCLSRGAPRVVCELLRCKFTPIRLCHGDLTVENAVWTGSHVVFLDPGYSRGLPCRELEEAKMMQSHDGWNSSVANEPLPFEVTRTHKLLLLTHYVRLLPYSHSDSRKQFARGRIKELLSELE